MAETWTTKDGRIISIDEMEDTHLRNTIKFLIRIAEAVRINICNLYSSCAGPQGEMASMEFDREADAAFSMDLDDILRVDPRFKKFKALMDEYERRYKTRHDFDTYKDRVRQAGLTVDLQILEKLIGL